MFAQFGTLNKIEQMYQIWSFLKWFFWLWFHMPGFTGLIVSDAYDRERCRERRWLGSLGVFSFSLRSTTSHCGPESTITFSWRDLQVIEMWMHLNYDSCFILWFSNSCFLAKISCFSQRFSQFPATIVFKTITLYISGGLRFYIVLTAQSPTGFFFYDVPGCNSRIRCHCWCFHGNVT